MGTLTIRIDDASRDELEELAATGGVTLSQLLRNQVAALLGRDLDLRGGEEAPRSLSMQQRHQLAQHHQILSMLHTHDRDVAEYHADLLEVLQEGYAAEYHKVFAAIAPEMSRAECVLVWEILDMFRLLGQSVKALSPVDREVLTDDNLSRLGFQGFDANDTRELQMLGYVRYLVRTGRWPEVRHDLIEIGDDGDSHSSSLPSYERMLAVFKPLMKSRSSHGWASGDARHLKIEELRLVAEAWAWPSS